MIRLMRKLAYLIFVLAAIFYGSLYWSFSPNSTQWQELAVSTTARFEGPGVQVGDRLYLFFGYDDYLEDEHTLVATNDVSSYDPKTDEWTRHAPGPFTGTHVIGAYDGTHVWFAGGFSGNHPGTTVATVWKYDPASDQWEAGPPLPAPVGGGSFVSIQNELHYISGYFAAEEEPATDYHWVLDVDSPENGWRSEPPLPLLRGHAGTVAIGDYIYIIGGSLTHHPTWIDSSKVHRYDVRDDTWTELADMPYPTSHFEPGTMVRNGDIYIAGGRNGASRKLSELEVQDILVYRTGTNQWQLAGSLPQPLRAPVAHFLDGRLIVTTGSTYYANQAIDTTYGIVCDTGKSLLCDPNVEVSSLDQLKLATKSFHKRLAARLPWRVQSVLGLKYFGDPD